MRFVLGFLAGLVIGYALSTILSSQTEASGN